MLWVGEGYTQPRRIVLYPEIRVDYTAVARGQAGSDRSSRVSLRIRHIVAACLLCYSASLASAALQARLAPGEGDAKNGFSPAVLTLTDAPADMSQVELQLKAGGVTMVYPVAVTEGKATVNVTLPAVAAVQVYTIRLRPSGETLSAEIHWPDAQITTFALLDSAACVEWQGDYPQWPDALRREIAWGAVAFAVAVGLTFIGVHHVRWRTVVVVVLLGVAISVASWRVATVSSGPVMTTTDSLMVLRTCRQQYEVVLDGTWRPIYATRARMQADTLRIEPDRLVLPTLRPSEIRLFRR